MGNRHKPNIRPIFWCYSSSFLRPLSIPGYDPRARSAQSRAWYFNFLKCNSFQEPDRFELFSLQAHLDFFEIHSYRENLSTSRFKIFGDSHEWNLSLTRLQVFSPFL